MKFTFKQIANSEAYQIQSEKSAKLFITVTFIVALCMTIWGDLSFSLHWFWIAPLLLFGSSILLAMPSMIVFIWIASLQSRHMHYELDGSIHFKNQKALHLQLLKIIWGIISPIFCGFITYYFLNFLDSKL